MQRKLVALLLCIILLVSLIPVQSFAEITISSYADFVKYMDKFYGGTSNALGAEANWSTYQIYNLIVYGSPFGDEKYSSKTGRTESRYLGYDYTGQNKVTNSFFPEDALAEGSTPMTWTYCQVDGADKSWDNLQTDRKNHMLNAKLSYNDVAYSISVSGSTTKTLGGIKYGKLLTAASWCNGFSVYTQHKSSSGKLWYATLYGPAMCQSTPTVACKISTSSDTYTIQADESSITVPVTVTSTGTISGTYAKASQVEAITATFEGQTGSASGSLTTSKTVNKILKKTDFKGSGTYAVTLKGSSTLKSIFNDNLSNTASKNITIKVSDDPNAGINLTATASPEKKQVDGSTNETVTVTANASIYNYTNAANISGWKWYAKLDGEESTLQSYTLVGVSLTSAKTFTFIVNKSKFNVDDFIQKIKVTAQANFTSKVGDDAYLTASTYTASEFYKAAAAPVVDPPAPLPGEPVAVINAPSFVYAGDIVKIDGLSSHSPNGAISSYYWNLQGTSDYFTGGSGSVIYRTEGTYTIGLTVLDELGCEASTSKNINVLPPTPKAIIKVTGSLKENRKFTIDAYASTGQTAFPIDTSLTRWSIIPVSGGTDNDIKYQGVLNGCTTKDVLIKTAGTYNISLTVTNTAGYSNTVTKQITIEPDIAPVAMFYTPDSIYRDFSDSDMASISITDQSYSEDNDYIASRVWSYAYDSDNDGDFIDESFSTLDSANNLTDITKKVAEVGKYRIVESVKEGFGQDTIPEFVTASDYHTASYVYTIEVRNIAPVASFALTKKKLVDITVMTDYTGEKLLDLTTQLGSLKTSVYANDVDLKYSIVDGNDKAAIGKSVLSENIVTTHRYNGGYYALDSNNNVVSNYDSITDLNSAREVVFRNGYTVTLKNDGTLWGWGNNNMFGQIPDPMQSDGYGTGYLSAPAQYTGISDVVDFVQGQFWLLALKNDGTLWSAGMFVPFDYVYGSISSLAYTGFSRQFPNASGIVQIVGADDYVLMLKNDGTVWGWGDNTYHQLGGIPSTGGYDGMGNYYMRAEYNQVPELSNVKKIYSGQNMSIAIKNDGTVWAWGSNSNNQLRVTSDGANAQYGVNCVFTPKQISGLDGNSIVSVKFGYNALSGGYFYFLKQDGTLWMSDYFGIAQAQLLQQHIKTTTLANGTKSYSHVTDSSTPLTDIVAMDTYKDSNVFLKSNGDIYCQYLQCFQPSGWATMRYYSSYKCATNMGGMVDIYAPNLSDVIQAPLMAGSDRYLLCLSDSAGAGYSNGYGSYFAFGNLDSDFTAKVVSDNYSIYSICPSSIYDYISGSSKQTMTIRNFTNSSPAEGKLYDAGQLSTALGDLQTKYSTEKENIIETYAIVNEDTLEYRTFYSDFENDPQYAERWRYDHTPEYFDNNTGTASFSAQYLTSPVAMFINPGRYDLTYQVRDNPKADAAFDNYKLWSGDEAKMTIYAHRRPIAQFSIGFTGLDGSGSYLTNVSENSYDPDHTSRADKGLVKKTWKWKCESDTLWKDEELPAALAPGKTYLVQLIVTDMEGADSYPYVQSIETTGNNFPPAVDANPAQKSWTNKDITVAVTATDSTPDLSYVEYKWNSVEEPTSNWTKSTVTATDIYTFNTTQTDEGIWYLHMKAFDASGNSFYRVRGPYNIDKTAPKVDCTPVTASVVSEDVDITISASDTGGSGLDTISYVFTSSTSQPSSGWTNVSAGGADSFSLRKALNTDGTWYLHMKATDAAGNTYYRYRGPYTRISLAISEVKITGYWNHWRGQTDIFGNVMTNEPHRFLSYEVIKIDVTTTGNPDRIEVEFSPELEAMQFTDKYGNVYDYKEVLGYYATFPLQLQKTGVNTATIEYTLPLAPSTIDSSNKRLREGYWMKITAINGEATTTYILDGTPGNELIDITGNIFDQTYIQPVQ